jgi:hypothetical protein
MITTLAGLLLFIAMALTIAAAVTPRPLLWIAVLLVIIAELIRMGGV